MLKKLTTFLGAVKEEMGHVSWLKRQDLVRYTLIVVVASVIVALYLWGFDLVFASLLNFIISIF
jgi:preprotein translocase SecE subunit